MDDICKDIQGELSSKSLGVGFVSQSNKIEEFSEHRRYLLSYINDVLYDISDYLEEPLYKGFHEAMDIMATIDMTDGKTDNTIGLQVDVQVSGRGMSYTNKQKMSELTLEDFIGSRYQETDGNSYVRNTYNQKVDGFADLFAEDYETFLKNDKIKQEEISLDDYLKRMVLKEFAHKKDSPFLIELLQQLSELTVVIPIYEAYKGKTLITKDNLTKTEEGYKLISATVNAFTLGHGAIISGGGASLAKLFASEIIAEVAVSSTVIGCEKAGVPTSVTFALALLAGAGAGAVSNKVLFKDYGIKIDDLDIEKLGKGEFDLVDDVIEGGNYSGDLMSTEDAVRYSAYWRELGIGSDKTWNEFIEANNSGTIDDYFKLVKEQSPWPDGYIPNDNIMTLTEGDTFNIVLDSKQKLSQPGGFAIIDDVPSVEFARNDMAIKLGWKDDCGKIATYRVKSEVELNAPSGPIGPQIDLTADRYLAGNESLTQLDLFNGLGKINRNDYIEVIPGSVRRLK